MKPLLNFRDETENSSQERRYKCDQCTMAFHRPGRLEKHLRVHNGEKPYRQLFIFNKLRFDLWDKFKNGFRFPTLRKFTPSNKELCTLRYVDKIFKLLHFSRNKRKK